MSPSLQSKPLLPLSLIVLFSWMALSLPALAEDEIASPTASIESEPSAPVVAKRKKGKKEQLSAEEIKALLAEIPEDHPQRADLRQLVLQGPPNGFDAREWLNLAMKFNFRSAGSARQISQAELD